MMSYEERCFWCLLLPGSDGKGRFSDFGLFLVNRQKLHVSLFRLVQISVAGAAMAAEGSGLGGRCWVDQCGGLGPLSAGWS